MLYKEKHFKPEYDFYFYSSLIPIEDTLYYDIDNNNKIAREDLTNIAIKGLLVEKAHRDFILSILDSLNKLFTFINYIFNTNFYY